MKGVIVKTMRTLGSLHALAVLPVIGALLAVMPTLSVAAGCPNEVLRAESNSTLLPDCRAYEMVSPVAKNGWSVQTLSADSSRVLVSSTGSFAGADQRGFENIFDIERTSGGWVTSPIVVPTNLVNTAVFNLLAASTDLTTGLFEYRFASGLSTSERNLYVQQLPDGEPIEVGPVFPEQALRSGPARSNREVSRPASMSNGHVLFDIGGPSGLEPEVDDLWPGDSTVSAGNRLGFGSLYEYEGTENRTPPKLVGVRNAGPLKSDDEAQLISQCGTSLGFPARGIFALPGFPLYEAYNSVSGSADASMVFFTAAAADEGPAGDACNSSGEGSGPPVDELYVRINSSETIAISEPSLSVPDRSCSGICREDENQENGHERSAGYFEGASEDGSKVFFLTSQPLVNGDEENATDLYEAEIGGAPGDREITRLVQVSHDPNAGEAAEVQGVARVSEDGSHVYFVASGALTAVPNSAGDVAQSGADNLYVYNNNTGRVAFIGRLCSGAESSGATAAPECPTDLNSEPPAKNGMNDLGDWQQEDLRPFDATPDGRFAVFSSYADLTPGDNSTARQVFEYDAETEQLVRISVGEDGFNNNGNTAADGAEIVTTNYAANENPAPQRTSVSSDGSIVVFRSSDALTSHAVEGFSNVYEYRSGQVYLISDGEDRESTIGGNPATSLVGIDGSGEDIFFTTADQLVPLDGDTQEDVYDARVGGGFPAPAARPACEGDGCQGASAPNPSFSTASSASQLAGEDIAVSPTLSAANTTIKPKKTSRCAKGKKLSHGKCVKTQHGRRGRASARRHSGVVRGRGR